MCALHRWLIVLACLAVSVIRFLGVTSQLFQGFAHILVGYLMGLVASRKGKVYAWLLAAITAVETACFFLLR